MLNISGANGLEPVNGSTVTIRDVKIWTNQIREEVLIKLNSSVAASLMDTIQVFRAAYTGEL